MSAVIQAFADSLRGVVQYFALALLGCLTAVAVVAWLARTIAAPMRRLLGGNVVRIVLVAMMVGTGIVESFSKHTNDPPRSVQSPNMIGRGIPNAPLDGGRGATALPPVTPDDITNGWRIAETREGCEIVWRDAFAALQIHAPWLARGGYKDKTRIVPYGWTFPWRDGTLDCVTVLSEGELRPNIRTRYFPPPFDAPLAVVPSFNWHLLPGGVSNVFWHAVSPSNSLVMTWENSPVNRDVNCLTNFQAELFADGSFEYRYDDRTVGYSRVHPLDLDFDGLPNDIDPAPEMPLGTSAWNQSEAWTAAAFPSNAAEIASAGGYAAWATQRAADPNRRLVGLQLASPGGRWPVCVEVGGVPVMADGSAELLYAIDCGAQVPFSLSDGELGTVNVSCAVTTSTFQTFTHSNFQTSAFPEEWSVGDVTVHLDDPHAGWIRRTAEVSVDDQYLTHLHPGDSAQLLAAVTNCHASAYLGCAWHGGAGISFSNPQSLATTITYASSNTVQWATNNACLVTSYAGGYCLTNTIWFTVGIEEEPTPCFTLGCQEVFFLNDADVLDGRATNRPERIRPVQLNLLGPYGTNGTVKLSAQGSASPMLFYIDNGVTNRIMETTELPLAVTDSFTRMGTNMVYVSCPSIGTGTISATLTLDSGATLSDTASFKCIEPLRRLVSMRQMPDGRFYNPSRLVMGTNAVLKVEVDGDFAATNVDWRVVSGPCRIAATNGWCVTVEPTGTNEDVVVEASFNDDEIQPRFVLPVVMPRIIPVKAFIVRPPQGLNDDAWLRSDVNDMIDEANKTFTQVGIRFELACEPENVGTPDDWAIPMFNLSTNAAGKVSRSRYITQHMLSFLDNYKTNDCVEVYYIGQILNLDAAAAWLETGIVVSKSSNRFTLAHEFGHALGLKDIYYRVQVENSYGHIVDRWLPSRDKIVIPNYFRSWPYDWGDETGRGFYGRSDTLATTIDRLLMNGYDRQWTGDIPDGRLLGLAKNADVDFQKVGVREIKKKDSEVFSK